MNCPYCHKYFDSKEIKMRSLLQQKYYWGVIVNILSNELGYPKNEMHEILKSLFLTEQKVLVNKKTDKVKLVPVYRSTTEITTDEAEKYYADIRQWASLNMNIYIPLPNEELIA